MVNGYHTVDVVLQSMTKFSLDDKETALELVGFFKSFFMGLRCMFRVGE